MHRLIDPRPLFGAIRRLVDGSVTLYDDNTPFTPTYADICVTRALLASCGLPMELVLEILAWAQYDPVLTISGSPSIKAHTTSAPSKLCINAAILSGETLDILQTRHASLKVKEIEFLFHSRDQGWTSQGTEGTFDTSSWLEVSIVRPENHSRSTRVASGDIKNLTPHRYPADLKPIFAMGGTRLVERPEDVGHPIQDGEGNVAWYLQGNQVAVAANENYPEYRVVWGPDYHEGNEGAGDGRGFIDALREGDSIIVWARSKYPGWQCLVKDITVTVRYGYIEHDQPVSTARKPKDSRAMDA